MIGGEAMAVLAGGFLGSAHCIGMCGGFAAAIAATDRPLWPVLSRQLVYNAGRIFTYAFLGALAGSTGFYLSQFKVGPVSPQQIFSLAAGLSMVGIGMSVLGLLKLPATITRSLTGLFSPMFAYFLNARGWFGYFTAGVANGFLPCGLVYSFLSLAAATGTLQGGIITMIFFGLGTVPAMLAIGCGTTLLTHATRMRIYRVAAVFVIALGAITIWRALPRKDPASCCTTAQLYPAARPRI